MKKIDHSIVTFYERNNNCLIPKGNLMILEIESLNETIKLWRNFEKKTFFDYKYKGFLYKTSSLIEVLTKKKEEEPFIRLINLLSLRDGFSSLKYDCFSFSFPEVTFNKYINK